MSNHVTLKKIATVIEIIGTPVLDLRPCGLLNKKTK